MKQEEEAISEAVTEKLFSLVLNCGSKDYLELGGNKIVKVNKKLIKRNGKIHGIPEEELKFLGDYLITLSNDDNVYYYDRTGRVCGVVDVDTLMFANVDTLTTLEETKELLKVLDTEKALQDTLLISLALLKNG